MLWVRLLLRARSTTLRDKVCQWLVADQWFSPGPQVSSTNKTDCHDITEILLNVALNTISPNPQTNVPVINMQSIDGLGKCNYKYHAIMAARVHNLLNKYATIWKQFYFNIIFCCFVVFVINSDEMLLNWTKYDHGRSGSYSFE